MESNRRTVGVGLGIVTILLVSAFAGIGPAATLFDGDQDGVYNWSDNCPNSRNENQIDTDLDSFGNACDDDDDGDGVMDVEDALPLDMTETLDLDSDGIGDNSDLDRDGDGIQNSNDAFPGDFEEQLDTDSDGIGNNADLDDDEDGVNDSADPFPLTANWGYNQTGPYTVGTQELTFISSTDIELTVQVWYPTSDDEGEQVIYDRVWPGNAWEDAIPDCSESHPVILYSHGTGSGLRWMSAFLTEYLTSHGFIVVAPDHAGDHFQNFDAEALPITLLRRPIDIRDAFDWISNQSQGDGQFSGCTIPDDGYAVMGHSGGGYTSLVASGATILIDDLTTHCDEGYSHHCSMRDHWLSLHPDAVEIDLSDNRIWGTIGLAPWTGFVLEDGVSNVDNPILILTGDVDETTNLTMVNGIVGDLDENLTQYGVFTAVGHYHFAPIGCDFYGCVNNTDIEIVKSLTNQSALVFFAQLLDWPNSSELNMPQSEYLTWL
ncbi:MAG: thrombospondin type 3 repeat-containing protein [Candidatus Poseidoniales archaeon]|nr:thrombospondin type 3 repeat-containing protein [Candidatus Poseidoniales archaeon]